MNNTKTLAIVAVLTAATLVVGLTVAAATPSAFAGGNKERQDKYMKGEQDGYKKVKQDSYKKNTYKKGGENTYKKGIQTNGNDGAKANGNTLTVQAAKQHGIVSGFDNTAEQEAQNLICTHPGNNATCTQEGAATAPSNCNGVEDDRLAGEEGLEQQFRQGDPDTIQPPGVVCPPGEDEPADQEEPVG
jgi:hypothetical protein